MLSPSFCCHADASAAGVIQEQRAVCTAFSKGPTGPAVLKADCVGSRSRSRRPVCWCGWLKATAVEEGREVGLRVSRAGGLDEGMRVREASKTVPRPSRKATPGEGVRPAGCQDSGTLSL